MTSARLWPSALIIFLIIAALVAAGVLLFLAARFNEDFASTSLNQDANRAQQSAFDALTAGRFTGALEQADASGDKAARQYFAWQQALNLTDKSQVSSSYIEFHKAWPQAARLAHGRIQDRAGVSDASLIAHYALHPPQTLDQQIAEFTALKNLGWSGPLQAKVQAFWRQGDALSAAEFAEIISEFGEHLSPADHEARFHHILGQTAGRDGLPGADLAQSAAQMRDLIPDGFDLVRVAWATGEAADLNAVPREWRSHAALIIPRVWAAQGSNNAQAVSLFRLAIDPATRNPAAEWRLRRILIRNAVRQRAFGAAYDLAVTHGLPDGNDALVAELLAGWIALDRANLPELALQHFEVAATRAAGPWIRTKALRGLSRAQMALGREDDGLASLQACAAHQTTLHALLCLETLDMPLTFPRATTTEPRNAVSGESLGAVTQMLIDNARPEVEVLPYARAAFAAASNPAQLVRMSRTLANRPDLAFTRTIGVMAPRGTPIFHPAALPLIALNPEHQSGLEEALTLAVIAQESQFRPAVGSPAGARGLMQLMPATAAQMAAELGLAWSPDMVTDPAINVRLGNAYLAKLIARYDGAVLLALAAYNAGPSRVDTWLADFGDPRTGAISAEDWIEAMTIGETRIYVQRVLTNIYLYRAALTRRSVDIDLSSLMIGQ